MVANATHSKVRRTTGRPRSIGWIDFRQCPAPAQTSSPQPDTERNQQQAKYKNAREDQKNQKANIRMRRPRQEDVIEPEGDGGERRARRDHGARKSDGILPQEVDWLRPVSDALSQIHLKPPLSLFLTFSLYVWCRVSTQHMSCRGSSAALNNLPDFLISGTGQDYFFSVRI